MGDAQFKKELLDQMHGSFGADHGGEEREESREAQAERLLETELKRLGWSKERLSDGTAEADAQGRLRQGASGTTGLRKETTMTLSWIAKRLAMGSPSTVAQSLWRIVDCRD